MKKTNFSFHKRNHGTLPESIAIVPLKDDVIFPHLILPLSLAGEGLVKAVNDAVSKNEFIGIVALKYDVDLPKPEDFYLSKNQKIFKVLKNAAPKT
ncbi:MAG: ATP-dependent Lon protease [Thermodesulfobacteriota bacterium]|nr:ATP-dependent Lon protease [Thermodesulfobacteriota bacterium]